MYFVPEYPEDDKSYLDIEQLDNNSVKISFKVLPKYIWKLASNLSTTIWWAWSGYINNPKAKKHLNKIAEIANNETIYKDQENDLKILLSYWSDDITIINSFNDVQNLLESYEITLNMDRCNSQILEELILLLNDDSYNPETVKEVESWTRRRLNRLGCNIV